MENIWNILTSISHISMVVFGVMVFAAIALAAISGIKREQTTANH